MFKKIRSNYCILKCHLFGINLGRSVVSIYSYFSLTYSIVTHEISTIKSFRPRNIHEKKIWTHEIPTRKNFGPTEYPRQELLDPRNTHEKNSEPTNHPRGKVLDPQNTHKERFRTHKCTIARDPRDQRWHKTYGI